MLESKYKMGTEIPSPFLLEHSLFGRSTHTPSQSSSGYISLMGMKKNLTIFMMLVLTQIGLTKKSFRVPSTRLCPLIRSNIVRIILDTTHYRYVMLLKNCTEISNYLMLNFPVPKRFLNILIW